MKLKRKIPAIMFTQHPDNAGIPYWYDSPLIKTHREPKECFQLFSDFGGHEFMWDWEGKLVDESVIERFFSKYHEYFSKNQIGKDVFLTFRIPNPKVESGFKLGKTFITILSAEQIAKRAGMHTPPLFEVILPLTESASDLYNINSLFRQISNTMSSSFNETAKSLKDIELIPLFESVQTIMRSGKILDEYTKIVKKELGKKLKYIRPFVARSDPALNSGIVATTLSIKWALSEFAKFSAKTNIATYPIIGPGVLPFRGGLEPKNVRDFVREFAGVRTVLIQSSYRYDFPFNEVKKSLKDLVDEVPKHNTRILLKGDLKNIKQMITWFEEPYKKSVENIAKEIQKVSKYIPQRRERVQHIGLFGYSRSVGKLQLPRAIGFTASCYSLGIPPEFFGVGEGLKKVTKAGLVGELESFYQNLKPNLLQAGRFLRKKSLKEFNLKDLEEEIDIIEKYLGTTLGPKTESDKLHEKYVTKIIHKLSTGKNPKPEIEKAAMLRNSLG